MRLILPLQLAEVATVTVASQLQLLPPIITREVLDERCRAGAPPDLIEDRYEMTTTALGWPCVAIWGRTATEHVVRVYYRFLDHGALAEVRTSDAESLERAWSHLAEARPDWSGELAALSQLYE